MSEAEDLSEAAKWDKGWRSLVPRKPWSIAVLMALIAGWWAWTLKARPQYISIAATGAGIVVYFLMKIYVETVSASADARAEAAKPRKQSVMEILFEERLRKQTGYEQVPDYSAPQPRRGPPGKVQLLAIDQSFEPVE